MTKLRYLSMVGVLTFLAVGTAVANERRAVPSAGPRINPAYDRLESFSAFREKVIEDGWLPVPNPDCLRTVIGGSHKLCAMLPEIFVDEANGYYLMRYMKEGVPASVTVYGDVQDLDAPGRYGLLVVGWEYSESLDVMLMDE